MKKILLFASAVAVLFSSCSTDNTTDVIGDEAKTGTISAQIAYQQDGTRTYLDEAYNVVWSKGDALGVFGETGPQVQFGLVSGEDTTSGSFAGNKNYLNAEAPLYAYYPYTKGTTMTNQKITLDIAGVQTYLPTSGVGSFDAAQAPAVAHKWVAGDLNDINLDFVGVASYLSFPITGVGTIDKLRLTIDGQALYGTADVDFSKWPTTTTANPNDDEHVALAMLESQMDDANTSVVVECGALQLDYKNPVYVMFVVPVGVDTNKAIKLEAHFAGTAADVWDDATRAAKTGSKLTTRNDIRVITPAGQGTSFEFGLDGKYVIDGENAVLDFITYAYLAQEGTAANVTDWLTIFEKFGDNAYELEALIMADELDFAAFDAAAKFNSIHATGGEALSEENQVYSNALAWYIKNGNAIKSLKYNTVAGAPYSGNETAVLKNLKVVGTGLSMGTSLKNLTLEGVQVVGTDITVDNAGLIAATNAISISEFVAANPAAAPREWDMTIDNVIIGAGNSVNVKAKNVGGIYGTIVSDKGSENIISEEVSAIAIAKAGTVNTGRLYGVVKDAMSIDLDDYAWDTTVASFPVVGYFHNGKTLVVDGTIDASMANMLNQGVVGKVVSEAPYPSSIIVNGTSYWNGGAEKYVSGKYYTAENFAWAVMNGGDDIVLKNDIDMQCSYNLYPVEPLATVNPIVANPVGQTLSLNNYSSATKFTVTSAGNNVFEIKNIIATSEKARAALFGVEAELTNVTLSNVAIYAYKSTATSPIKTFAGIAGTGKATNVTINGLTINLASDAVLDSTLTSIGGLFGTVAPGDVVDVTVSALAINGPVENVDVRAGIIAGTLNVAPTTVPVVLEGIKLTGNDSDYVVGNFGEKYKASNNISAFKSSVNYAGAYPFGTISVTNAAFPANSKGKAYVGVDSAFKTWGNGNRLAAGVVFADDLTSAQAAGVKVKIGKPAADATVKEYDYALELTGGVIVGNKNTTNFFGFTK